MLYPFLIFLISLFHFVNNFIWLRIATINFSGHDSIHHLLLRNEFYWDFLGIISNKECVLKDSLLSIAKIFSTSSSWPKFVYFISSVVSLLFANTIFVVFISSTLYLIILIISLYLIGKECVSKEAGILAAFLISFFPAVFGLSRSFGLDLPLTAMTALTIFSLLRTENFKNMKYSVTFGVSLGLGILTKGQIMFFILGPVCCILYETIYREKEHYLRCSLNILIAFFISAIISSLWWWGNIKAIIVNEFFRDLMGYAASFVPGSCPEVLTFRWLFFYFLGTIVNISALLLLSFIVIIPYFIKSKIKHKAIIISWIIIPYLIFTIIYTKNARYYLPAFPAFALVLAFGMLALRHRWKKLIILIISAWSICQFFYLSYVSFSFLPRLIQKTRKIANFYGDRDPLYYPVFWHKVKILAVLDIARSLDLAMQNEIHDYYHKNIKIGFIKNDNFVWRYMYTIKTILFILGLKSKSVYFIENPKEYKGDLNFLLINSESGNIKDEILRLEMMPNLDANYRVIRQFYSSFLSFRNRVPCFIFLLKIENKA